MVVDVRIYKKGTMPYCHRVRASIFIYVHSELTCKSSDKPSINEGAECIIPEKTQSRRKNKTKE